MILLFEDCVRVNSELYFICREYNFFGSLNIETGEIQIIDSIPEGSVRSWRLGSKIVRWKNYLFFAPMCAEKIWRFDLTNKQWKGYERKKISNWTNNKDMFQAVLYKEKIFFIGAYYPAIIVLNPVTEEMEYITKPYENRIDISKEANDCWFRTDYVVRNNLLFLASCVDNTLLCFNLDTYAYKYIEIGPKVLKFSGIDFDGEYFYISSRKDCYVVVWDGEKIVKKITVDIEMNKNTFVFGGVTCLDNDVYIPAVFSKNSLIISKQNCFQVKKINKQYLFYKKIDDVTIVCLDSEGFLKIFYAGSTYQHRTDISDKVLGTYIKTRMLKDGEKLSEIEVESTNLPVGLFINMV